MGIALGKLAQEDPSFRVKTDEETGQTIISGMGELHLDVLVDRMRREFNVEANIGKPQVAYREKLKGSVNANHKFAKQSGGRGQYGHVVVEFSPADEGEGSSGSSSTKSLVVLFPKEYIPAIQKGIEEQMQNGVIAGYPLLGLKARLYDGSFHDVDSNEMAFKIAASQALKKYAPQAKPVLMEPMMQVEVVTPEDYMGDVMGDLNRRRGIVQGMEDTPSGKVINAQVPLGEMFGYATDLRSATQGACNILHGIREYAEAPPAASLKVIKANQG